MQRYREILQWMTTTFDYVTVWLGLESRSRERTRVRGVRDIDTDIGIGTGTGTGLGRPPNPVYEMKRHPLDLYLMTRSAPRPDSLIHYLPSKVVAGSQTRR
ncbi:hypothetical protein GJ744_006940 [Endocarpon pusillum]|uniref:Uncharacterized protein n=1 Tax=Endocarpon pusillum TaxID=364733 RepID=A0A8H7AMR3_9EURO|nr:hypothetical protein GJ744_006940 [Endocarpon pusillum]